MNVHGSAQPAAAHCAARLPHHRTASLVPTILGQGCMPQGAHPNFPIFSTVGKGCTVRCQLSLCPALMVELDRQGEAFGLPSLRPQLCPSQPHRQGTGG